MTANTAKSDPQGKSRKRRTKTEHLTRERRLAPELAKVLLTVDEAAHKLSIGRTTLYMLMKRGELRYITVSATRRVPVEAVSEYVARKLRDIA